MSISENKAYNCVHVLNCITDLLLSNSTADQWRSQSLPGWVTCQNEEENEKSLRKNKKKLIKFRGKVRKVEILPTRDCEAGYGPAS